MLRYVLTSAAARSGSGGTVTVAPVPTERAVLVSVTDLSSGTLVSETPRSPGSSQNIIGGSEVKLAICRHIMAAHGGRIWEETGDGGGVVVHLEIQESEPTRR